MYDTLGCRTGISSVHVLKIIVMIIHERGLASPFFTVEMEWVVPKGAGQASLCTDVLE